MYTEIYSTQPRFTELVRVTLHIGLKYTIHCPAAIENSSQQCCNHDPIDLDVKESRVPLLLSDALC